MICHFEFTSTASRRELWAGEPLGADSAQPLGRRDGDAWTDLSLTDRRNIISFVVNI